MRKRNVVLTAVPFALAGVIAASAYISQSVDASGKGSTATYKPITATVTGVPNDFAPGDTATVRLHVVNPNSFPVDLVGLKFAVTAPGLDKCPAGSFSFGNVSGGRAAANNESDAGTVVLTFNNLGVPQNGCLGEALTVTANAT